MKRTVLTMVFLITFCVSVFGQHGSAPDGYYPPGYSGDTWTGEVVSTDDTTREITLTYTVDGNKVKYYEIFQISTVK